MNVDVVHGDRPKHPLVGTVVEPYAILDVIAAGGMGVVFKARHTLTDRIVAMKLLPSELARDESNVQRVKLEAKALAQLKHPNIVTTFDFGFTAMQEPFIVMEYVTGESLKEVLDREVLLPVDRALKVFLQAVDGMRYAHSAKILHRDLKPHNIMVSNEPEPDHVKILDFGVAKLAEYTQKITRTGEVVGSPLYMSPEQCTGKPTDHRCDIYSIGVMMFETLTGNPPFRGENYISTVHLKCTKLAPSFKDVVPGRVFPERLEMIVLKCLEIDPDKRYSTMAELKADLELVAGVVPRVERVKTNQAMPPAQGSSSQTVGAAPTKADEIGWQPAWAGGQSATVNPAAARSKEDQFSDSIVTNVSDSTDSQSWRGPSSPDLSDDNWGNTDLSKDKKNQLGWSTPAVADDDSEWIPSTPPYAVPPPGAQKPLTQTQGLASLSAALEASSIGAGDMLNIKPGGFNPEGGKSSDDITGDKPIVDLEQTKGPTPIPLKKDESGDSHFVLTWDQKTGPSWSATTATPQRPKAPMGSMAGTRTRMPGMDANAIANAAVNASNPIAQQQPAQSAPGSGNSQSAVASQIGQVPANGQAPAEIKQTGQQQQVEPKASSPQAGPTQPQLNQSPQASSPLAEGMSQNPWGEDNDRQSSTGTTFNAAAHGWAPPSSTGTHQAIQQDAIGTQQQMNQGMTGTQQQMSQGMTGTQQQMNQGMTGTQQQMNLGMTGTQQQMNQGMTGFQQQMNQGMTGTQQQMNQGMTGTQPAQARQPHPGFPQPQQPHPGFPQPQNQSGNGPPQGPQGFPAQDNQGFQLPANQSNAPQMGSGHPGSTGTQPTVQPGNTGTQPVHPGFTQSPAAGQAVNSGSQPHPGFPPAPQPHPGFPQAGQGATGTHQEAPGMVSQQNQVVNPQAAAVSPQAAQQRPVMPDPWAESIPPANAVAQMTESETGVKHMTPWQDKTPPVGPVAGQINQPLFPPSPVAQLAASLMDDQSTKLTTDSEDAPTNTGGFSQRPIPASVQAMMPPPPPSRSQQNLQAQPSQSQQNMVPPSVSRQNMPPMHPGMAGAVRPGMSSPQPGMPPSMQPTGGPSLLGGAPNAPTEQQQSQAQSASPWEEPQVLGSNEPSPYQGAPGAMQGTAPTLKVKPDWNNDSSPTNREPAQQSDAAIKQFAERMKTKTPEPAQQVHPDTGKDFKSYEPVSLAELNAIKTPAPTTPKPTADGLSNALPAGHQTTGSVPVYNKKSRTRELDDGDHHGLGSGHSGGSRGAGSSLRFNTSRGGTDTKKTVLMTLVAVAIVAVVGIAGFMLLQHGSKTNAPATVTQSTTTDSSTSSQPVETETATTRNTSEPPSSATTASSSTASSTASSEHTATKPVPKPRRAATTPAPVAKKPQVAKAAPKKPKKPKAVAKTPASSPDTPSLPRRRRAYSTYDSYYSDGN